MAKWSNCSLDETIDWFKKARHHCLLAGRRLTIPNMRASLRSIKSPFTTEAVLFKWGIPWPRLRDHLEGQISAEDMKSHRIDGVSLQQRSQITGEEFASGDFDAEAIWQRMVETGDRRLHQAETEAHETVQLDHDGPVGIILMGDTHIGAPATDYRRLEWVAQQLERDDLPIYGIQIGDLFDSMFWSSVEMADQIGPLDEQVVGGTHWLKRVTPKMIGIVAGNHDLWAVKQTTGIGPLDLALAMVKSDVPYNRIQLTLDVELGECTYRFVLRHAVKGSSQYRAEHGVDRWHIFHDVDDDADAVVAGHTHKSGISRRRMKGRMRYGFQLGAYKQWAGDSYAIEKGFADRNEQPDSFAILHPDRHAIEPFEITEQGLRLLKAEWDEINAASRKKSRAKTAAKSKATKAKGKRSGNRSRSS